MNKVGCDFMYSKQHADGFERIRSNLKSTVTLAQSHRNVTLLILLANARETTGNPPINLKSGVAPLLSTTHFPLNTLSTALSNPAFPYQQYHILVIANWKIIKNDRPISFYIAPLYVIITHRFLLCSLLGKENVSSIYAWKYLRSNP